MYLSRNTDSSHENWQLIGDMTITNVGAASHLRFIFIFFFVKKNTFKCEGFCLWVAGYLFCLGLLVCAACRRNLVCFSLVLFPFDWTDI